MDALLASFFLQSTLACVFLVALWGIVFIYRRPLHTALAIGWSVYLLHILASLTAAWSGRVDPLASVQWSTATVQLLAVLGSFLWWASVVRILAGRESTAVVSRQLLIVTALVAAVMIGASLAAGRILHQPGSGPLGWLYPVPYLLLASAAWRASRDAANHRRSLQWFGIGFVLFAVRLLLVTQVILPEAMFADATLPRLLAVATTQIVQMVAVGVISIGVAVAYERTAVVQQAARVHQIELRLQRSERLEMLGRMAAEIAHDFNNVLAAISAGAELARASVAEPALVSRELDELTGSIARALSLTKRLITFAKTGQSTALSAIGVDETLRATASMLERVVGPDRTLRLLPDSADARVALDRVQAEQVLLNLVVNARDATAAGGLITVQSQIAELRADRRVHGAVLLAGRYVCLSVIDTGTGIPTDLLSRVFEPFFSTKDADGGTGIGLATVQQIVVSAHGEIEISSTVGVGSRFDVYLPACQ